jgi:glucan phosphorylase
MKHISMYNVKNNIQQINEGIFDGITGFFNTMFQDIVNFTPLKDSVKDSDNRSEFEKALEAAQDQRFSLMEQQREKIEQAKDKLKAELVKTKAAAEQNQIQLKTNKLLDRYNRQINDLKKFFARKPAPHLGKHHKVYCRVRGSARLPTPWHPP